MNTSSPTILSSKNLVYTCMHGGNASPVQLIRAKTVQRLFKLGKARFVCKPPAGLLDNHKLIYRILIEHNNIVPGTMLSAFGVHILDRPGAASLLAPDDSNGNIYFHRSTVAMPSYDASQYKDVPSNIIKELSKTS